MPLVSTESSFDDQIDSFSEWVDGSTEVTASRLNQIRAAVENVEYYLLTRFGPSALDGFAVYGDGRVNIFGGISSYEAYTRTAGAKGLRPFLQGDGNSVFYLTVRHPVYRAATPSVAVNSFTVYRDNTNLTGSFTCTVSQNGRDATTFKFSAAGDYMAQPYGYAVSVNYSVS